MEVDTGATLSVISEETWRRHWTRPRPHLEHSHDTLRTYTGQCVKIKGIVDVKVEGKKGECHTLPLMVVPGNGPSLLGRNWLSMLQLDWTRILFTYKRLPYGVSSAPGIYQRVMDSLLKGIKNTMVYLDDVLVTGRTDEEHLQTLDLVMERLMSAGSA